MHKAWSSLPGLAEYFLYCLEICGVYFSPSTVKTGSWDFAIMTTTLERKPVALFYKTKITVYDKEILHI